MNSVKLADLTDTLCMSPDESRAWLDRETGRVEWVDHEVLRAVEGVEGDAMPEGLEDWQQEQVPAARGILDGDARYLALPDKFEFHEYRQMERFIGTMQDAATADELWRAIKGKGAFRYFKDTASRLGVLDRWYGYRDEAAKTFMLDWAAAHGVTVDRTPRHALPQ